MIVKGSRYATGTVSTVQTNNGELTTYVSRRPPAPPAGELVSVGGVKYGYRVIVDGDRLDNYADEYFGDPKLWWIIADLNPQIESVMMLTPGNVLRVPRA